MFLDIGTTIFTIIATLYFGISLVLFFINEDKTRTKHKSNRVTDYNCQKTNCNNLENNNIEKKELNNKNQDIKFNHSSKNDNYTHKLDDLDPKNWYSSFLSEVDLMLVVLNVNSILEKVGEIRKIYSAQNGNNHIDFERLIYHYKILLIFIITSIDGLITHKDNMFEYNVGDEKLAVFSCKNLGLNIEMMLDNLKYRLAKYDGMLLGDFIDIEPILFSIDKKISEDLFLDIEHIGIIIHRYSNHDFIKSINYEEYSKTWHNKFDGLLDMFFEELES